MSLDFGKLNYAVSLKPLTAFPLDARSYFESYDLALEAALSAKEAGDSTTIYYYGQVLEVVENGVAKQYQIQPDNTLSEVGSNNNDSASNEAVEELKTSVSELTSTVGDLEEALNNKANSSDLESLATKTEVEEALSGKANSSDLESLATKTEVEEALNNKADSSNVFTKEEINSALEGKANVSDLNLKANAADVYTKLETEEAIEKVVSEVEHLKRIVVDDIDIYEAEPSLAEKNTIYMIKAADSGDMYKEYMRFDDENGFVDFIQIGDTSVDLSAYAKTADVDTKLESYAKTEDLNDYVQSDILENYVKTEDASATNDALTVLIQANANALKEKANNSDLISLQEVVNTKADSSTVTSLQEVVEGNRKSISDNAGQIALIQESLNNKANASDLEDLRTAVNNKVESSAFLTLQETVRNKANSADVYNKTEIDALLADKVDTQFSTVDGEEVPWILLSPENQKKLAALTIDGDSIGISGNVNAENVTGLADWISSTANRDTVKGLFSTANETKLNGIETGAQVNKIEAIYTPDGNELAIRAKSVTLPYATNELPGLIKVGNEFKMSAVNALEVNAINVNKLVQTEDLLLNCGGAAPNVYTA